MFRTHLDTHIAAIERAAAVIDDDDDEDDDDNDDYDDDDVVLAQIPVKDDDEHGEGKGF